MRVSELEKIGIIREVHLRKGKNSHTECKVNIYFDSDDKIAQLNKLVGKEVCVEDDQRIYLRGLITYINCSVTYSGSYACVVISSLSKKLDVDKKYCIYQDTKKKYKDVIAFFSQGGNNIQITDNELANTVLEEVLVQEGKTDFEFIKEISNNAGYDLYILDTETSPCIQICKSTNYSRACLTEENTKTYNYEKSNSAEKLTISTTDFLELGQLTEYEGVQYTVISVAIDYIDGVIRFTFVLEKKDMKISSVFYSGNLGEAEVISVDDPENRGRIQVKFIHYEDKMNENKIWIPFLNNVTEKKQGSMIIPGVEEIVNVICRNGICYSNGCVRIEAYDETMNKPEERILKFKDKSITINDSSISINAFSNVITMCDGKISISNGDSAIDIEKDSLFVQIGESKVKIDKSAVQIQASEKVEIKSNKMNIDVGGKLGIKATSLDVG